MRNVLKREHLRQIFLPFLCLVFAIALGSYALVGSHMRYSGDDYCYGAVLTTHGVFKAQWFSYFNLTAYHGNRYSLTLFSGLAGLFPPVVSGVLPGLAILSWVAGLTWVIRGLSRLLWHRQRTAVSLLFAEFIVFLSLYQAPDLSQSLYWRSGMLPYLAPLIFVTLMIGLILHLVNRVRLGISWGALLGVLAFISGGFSETGAVFQLSLLVFLVLLTAIVKRFDAPRSRRAFPPLGIAIFGTVLALLVLYLSPSNTFRQMNLPAPPDLLTLANLSLRNARDFIRGSFEALPLPSIYTVVFCVVFTFNFSPVYDEDTPMRIQKLFLEFLITSIVVYLLVVSVMIPFAYTQRAYPEPRALITSRYVMVLGLTTMGSILGYGGTWLFARIPWIRPFVMVVSVLLIGLLALYPLRASKNVISELPRYQKWSRFWDDRDREIRDASERGVQDIEVVEIDHIIPRVGELSPDPGYWYNGCAAKYYGVVSISASLSGWDD